MAGGVLRGVVESEGVKDYKDHSLWVGVVMEGDRVVGLGLGEAGEEPKQEQPQSQNP